jgi:hypothetical protein
MNKSSKFYLRYLFVLVLFLISGCGNGNTSTWNQPFPAGDILFQSRTPDNFKLNMIQADGANHQTMDLPHSFVKPISSTNGEIIYGLSNPRGMIPYHDGGYPAYWNIKSRKFKDCIGDLPLYTQIEPSPTLENPNMVIISNYWEIVLFDLDTCKKINTVFDVYDQEVHSEIQGFSNNPETRELVFGEIVNTPYPPTYHINMLNLNTGEKSELANGFYAIWSPDGTEIAFFGFDGLYVLNMDENKTRRLITIQFSDLYGGRKHGRFVSPPHWSPDGEWLVYHLCGDDICTLDKTTIYKIRVSDGFQAKLFTGGEYPTWMP